MAVTWHHAEAMEARLLAKYGCTHYLTPPIKGGLPLLIPHNILSNTSLPHSLVVGLLSFSSLEQGKATLESLAPWKKCLLGMNRNIAFIL
jgi:hypothetical protein